VGYFIVSGRNLEHTVNSVGERMLKICQRLAK